MASEAGCGELLARLSDMATVTKAVERDLPFPGTRAELTLLVALDRCGEPRLHAGLDARRARAAHLPRTAHTVKGL